MTESSLENDTYPVMYLQSDWNDFIFSKNNYVWISIKFIGQKTIHSKLECHGEGTPTSICKNFSVLYFSENNIAIKYNVTGHVFIFVSPTKVFSEIHEKKITSLDVTKYGLGLSVCEENVLKIWDMSGKTLKTFYGHTGSVYKCKFFPSGQVVLSAGADMQLKIWSAESGDCPVTLIGHKAAINDFCIIDRGRNVVSVSKDGTSKLWDCGKSSCLDTIFESENVLNCCAIGLLPKSINFIREKPVNDREIGTINKYLAIGTEEGLLHCIGIFCRNKISTVNVGSAVNAVIILGDKIVVGCQNGKVEIYKLDNTIQLVNVYDESTSPVTCGCAFKENGFLIGRNDGSVIYYSVNDIKNGRLSLTGPDFDTVFEIVSIENNIFTACRDKKIRKYIISDTLVNTIT